MCGSLALEACGFPLLNEPNDIDMEVLDSPEMREFLTNVSLSSDDDKLHYHNDEDNRIDIIWRGVKMNIWLVKEFDSKQIWSEHIRYSTIEHVLKYKLQYGRKKDLEFLSNAISKITSYLNSGNEHIKKS